ncbi:MAG TPA: hypothetical protein VFE17_05115 [Candidatus Baltobacteraceae bacterium]|jgi:hypothetical protein|nr:hypothetical protein [Candidatus Baltobacteraceae bacterium]
MIRALFRSFFHGYGTMTAAKPLAWPTITRMDPKQLAGALLDPTICIWPTPFLNVVAEAIFTHAGEDWSTTG